MSPQRPYRPIKLAALCAVVLIAGCSQEKDAFLNRTYHKLTARDNGWFNANEKLKEVVVGIEDAHVDDFDQVLPLFVYGTEEQARAAIPDLEKCIDKCSVVIDRHSMDIEGKEKNQWIDDAWFVIAKSQFYKRNYYEAERGFTYISRRFKGGNRDLESELWLARTAINLEQFGKAQSALDHVRDIKKPPKDLDHAQLSAVQAELELKRGKVDDAIMQLERAVPLAKHKRERVRWAFILAQLYELKGKEEEAIKQYAAVVKMNPPYELAFHAQIYQALAFNKGDSKAMRKKLNRMLRDDKHIDHFDMIHYALADLDMKDRLQPDAIAQLETSVRVSTTDMKQKAKSFLKLADIYFDDRDYVDAQRYYDSTQTLLAETHPRFEEVKTRARVLGDLVEQLAIIAHEDSMQALAGLNEEDLAKKIKDIIKEREEEEAEKERLEEEARSLPPGDGVKPPAPTPGAPARGNWYFYDPQQIGRGLSNFRKKWGGRKLEDDWRRQDKSGSALAESVEDAGEDALAEAEKEKEKGEAEWKDPGFYTKDIPRDAEALASSNVRICEALYVSGMIYKEQLKDVDNAIESFEVLNNRFEECRYTPESHYQLYRIYLEKEQAGWFSLDGIGSQTYANIVLERWPDSEFARLVRDPNLLQADEVRKKEEEAAYKEVYMQYRQYAFGPVISACTRVLAEEPRNNFRPKYHILKAMAIGGTRDMGGYRSTLGEVKATYPGTDEAKAADDLLAALDNRAGAPPPRTSPVVEYSLADGAHYYAIVVPNKDTDVQMIREKLADFNRTFFRNTPLEITSSFLDPQNQVVLLSGFASRAPAMEYHMLFRGNEDMLMGINDQDYPAFAISTDNYAQLFKSKDVTGYQTFFVEKYVEGQ
ncbi:MAG: tetratricopeptide repeat protein [Flavobacteriales bacterium]